MKKTEPVELPESLASWCKKGAAGLGIDLNEKQTAQFDSYHQLILKKNKEMNLTSILEAKEVALKHVVDSLTCLLVAPLDGTPWVIDVGAGAGLPGIPVKIARPQMNLFLLDSAAKKVHFLQDVIKKLSLADTEAVHGRAEDLARQKNWRGQFDYALSRALAPLSVVIEYCLAFLKIGGFLIVWKGPAAVLEIENCRRALSVMGGALREVKELTLPFIGHERRLIVIEKVFPTPPQYPRRPGIPGKKPL